MVHDGRMTPVSSPFPRALHLEWAAGCTVFLRPADLALGKHQILMYEFGREIKQFLHPLLEAQSPDTPAVQQLMRTPTSGWKMMVSPAVSEYILAAPNVHVRGTLWTIECMRTALLPSMVVTSVPLLLLDDEVKEGLIAGLGRTLPVPE